VAAAIIYQPVKNLIFLRFIKLDIFSNIISQPGGKQPEGVRGWGMTGIFQVDRRRRLVMRPWQNLVFVPGKAIPGFA